MSNIVLNIIIISVIIGPMAYFMFSGSNHKAATKQFMDKLKEFGFKPENIGYFQNACIAIDKNKSELCFYQLEEDSLLKISLSDVDKASVTKLYQTESVHDQDISILKSVSILLKKKDKTEVKLPVFNIEKHPNVGSDLMEAVQWSEKVNKLTSK